MNYLQEHKRKHRNANRMVLILGSALSLFGGAGVTATNDFDYLVLTLLGAMAVFVGLTQIQD